jgi:DNA-directed RNA polymerase specialized sigma24 family protein
VPTVTDLPTEYRELFERHAKKELPTSEIAEILLEVTETEDGRNGSD